jgi:hypothetical protein
MFLGVCFLAIGSASIARGDDAAAGPTIVKDRVLVSAFTVNSYKGDYKVFSWLPQISFRVNGPIASGSQLWAEFKLPTGPFVKFDCKTEETEKDHWWNVENAGGRDAGEDKGITYTGPVDFAIHIRNELAGTDATLFTGKFKVAKVHSNETGPDYVNHMVYYVDQDWNMPIGYVFLNPDDVRGMKLPGFNAAFWVRGAAEEFQPHLFHDGKEVGKITLDGEEIGKAGGEAELSVETTQYVDETQLPEKARWSRVICSFPNVKAWNESGDTFSGIPGQKGSIYFMKDNPGEYEVKVLRKGKLARSMKFTIKPDGSFDDSITTANKMGDKRAIVPVKIIGDQDGKWDKDAWKTDAFYGNPLTGFTAVE